MEFTLRHWQKEDAKSISQAANNPNIAKYLRDVFPYPYTLADAEFFIELCTQHGNDNQLNYAIVIDGKAVGSISVQVKTDVYRKSAELGYWLSQEYWGKGVMSAAVKQICKEAFQKFDIVRIYAEPFAHNAASRKVLQNSGFLLEGIMKNGVFKNSQVYDYCMYALLK